MITDDYSNRALLTINKIEVLEFTLEPRFVMK